VFAKRLADISTAVSPIPRQKAWFTLPAAAKVTSFVRGDKYDEVSMNDLNEPCGASPAVAEGKLIIKGKQHLFCIGRSHNRPLATSISPHPTLEPNMNFARFQLLKLRLLIAAACLLFCISAVHADDKGQWKAVSEARSVRLRLSPAALPVRRRE